MSEVTGHCDRYGRPSPARKVSRAKLQGNAIYQSLLDTLQLLREDR
jgi:hypothetical protein